MNQPIPWFGPTVTYFEKSLAQLEKTAHDPEHTLFVQLTEFEVCLLQYGLTLIGRMYGYPAISDITSKLHDLIETQEFCTCPRCEERRASREENGE